MLHNLRDFIGGLLLTTVVLQNVIGVHGLSSSAKQDIPIRSTWSTTFVTELENEIVSNNKIGASKNIGKLRRLFRRNKKDSEESDELKKSKFKFEYDCNVLYVPSKGSSQKEKTTSISKCVLLIQPIGVGIGRWYYDRLLDKLNEKEASIIEDTNVAFLAPDLLGCGSAAKPMIQRPTNNSEFDFIEETLPLLTVNDWGNQLNSLMRAYEIELGGDVEWSIVANGGCVSICFELGKRAAILSKKNSKEELQVSSLCLTAPPRLPSILMNPNSQEKLLKSYSILCGTAGKLFWWYSLRNNGKFIEQFSVKNLVARKENLGPRWLSQCVETAKSSNGYSKYSTFSFLSGSLQGGNKSALDLLKDFLPISVIRGGDIRINPAKSWFWKKRKEKDVAARSWFWKKRKEKKVNAKEESLSDFLGRNGNIGNEITVGGRRCPAHEDAEGFADALLTLFEMRSK